SRRRHTRFSRDWSSDVCSSDLTFQPRSTLQATGCSEMTTVFADMTSDAICAFHDRHVADKDWARASASAADVWAWIAADHRCNKIGRASCRERVEDKEGAGA